MARYSRRQLAKGYLRMAKGRAQGEAMKALAALIRETNLKHEADLVMQEVAREVLFAEGRLLAGVATARVLTAEAKRQVEGWLREVTGAQTVTADYRIEPALVGGIRVTTPRGVLDASITNKLE